ncbi:MAG: FAD-dependent oxidoreductase [Anaerolineales bacterium]
MSQHTDVIVIGAGIIGASCSYYLGAAGLNVHLVERHFPASGTSRACEGLILLWDKLPGVEFALGQASASMWVELAQSLNFDIGYARRGTLLLAEGEADLEAGIAKAEALRKSGVPSELLDDRELRSLEPNLAPDLAGGVLFPADAHLDARRATLAFITAAQRRFKLNLHTQAEITEICRVGGGRSRINGVKIGSQEISADHVVCTAGVWSNEVASMVGLQLPIRPRKGHVLVTSRIPGSIHHPLMEGGYACTVQSGGDDLQVAMVAELTEHDTMLLGSSRQFSGYDRSVSLEVIRAIAARASRFLPSLANVPIIRSYAGLRPWSPDHLPLIGPVEEIPGFYLAAGHEGAGIGLAPITGRLIADWVTGSGETGFREEILPGRFDLHQKQSPSRSAVVAPR